MTALIVWGSIFTWLLAGAGAAYLRLPVLWSNARNTWKFSNKYVRESVYWRVFWYLLGGPIGLILAGIYTLIAHTGLPRNPIKAVIHSRDLEGIQKRKAEAERQREIEERRIGQPKYDYH